jgi:hypothetical protein
MQPLSRAAEFFWIITITTVKLQQMILFCSLLTSLMASNRASVFLYGALPAEFFFLHDKSRMCLKSVLGDK